MTRTFIRCETGLALRTVGLPQAEAMAQGRLAAGRYSGFASLARKRKSAVVAPTGWLIVVVNDKCEFEAKRELHKQGYECEFPMLHAAKRNYHGRLPVLPLFEGYVFVRETARWWAIKGTRGVSHLLMSSERPAVLADDELAFFLSVSVDANGYYTDPVQKLFKEGGICIPRSGRFAGIAGKLSRMNKDGRTEILFEMLGRSVRTTEYRVTELA